MQDFSYEQRCLRQNQVQWVSPLHPAHTRRGRGRPQTVLSPKTVAFLLAPRQSERGGGECRRSSGLGVGGQGANSSVSSTGSVTADKTLWAPLPWSIKERLQSISALRVALPALKSRTLIHVRRVSRRETPELLWDFSHCVSSLRPTNPPEVKERGHWSGQALSEGQMQSHAQCSWPPVSCYRAYYLV